MTYVLKRAPLHADHKSLYLRHLGRAEWQYTEHLDKATTFATHHDVLTFATKVLVCVHNLGGDTLSIVEVTEKTSYRVSKPDSNGTRWQVRDGVTWFRTKCSRTFHKHVDVQMVLDSMVSLKRYDDVAILADIAANPGTSTLTEK